MTKHLHDVFFAKNVHDRSVKQNTWIGLRILDLRFNLYLRGHTRVSNIYGIHTNTVITTRPIPECQQDEDVKL